MKNKHFIIALLFAVIAISFGIITGVNYFIQPKIFNQPAIPTRKIATVSATGIRHSEVAGAALSGAVIITWQTADYPQNAGVNINLLKKISASPVSYELVDKIATDAPNTGSFNWIPGPGETGKNLFVQVTCGAVSQLSAECQTTSKPLPVN